MDNKNKIAQVKEQINALDEELDALRSKLAKLTIMEECIDVADFLASRESRWLDDARVGQIIKCGDVNIEICHGGIGITSGDNSMELNHSRVFLFNGDDVTFRVGKFGNVVTLNIFDELILSINLDSAPSIELSKVIPVADGVELEVDVGTEDDEGFLYFAITVDGRIFVDNDKYIVRVRLSNEYTLLYDLYEPEKTMIFKVS